MPVAFQLAVEFHRTGEGKLNLQYRQQDESSQIEKIAKGVVAKEEKLQSPKKTARTWENRAGS